MLGIGLKIELMEMGYIIIMMGHYMLDNGKKIINMVLVKKHGQMGLFMRVNFKLVENRAKGSLFGLMDHNLKEIF